MMNAPNLDLPRPPLDAGGVAALSQRLAAVRAQTLTLAEPLSEADAQVQSMPDASPTKWHLAHTTWFFETLVLERFEPGFAPFHPAFRVLFNSYYNGIGEQHARPQRGLITRRAFAEILAYRRQVDERIQALLAGPVALDALALVELGIQHEQQHQELILTDLKHLLSCNPLDPVYRPGWPLAAVAPVPHRSQALAGGTVAIGHGGPGFAFDNETPRHAQLLAPYALGRRLITHGEWLAFMHDGAYQDPRWWLSDGWAWVRSQGIAAPLYWQPDGAGGWTTFTLHGRVAVDPHTPVVHINLFEADAYARWRSAQDEGPPWRLPTEAEWEHAAQAACVQAHALADGNFLESQALHPMPVQRERDGVMQMLGDVWEWTASAYTAYPGMRPWRGVAGEYNAKFMVNQNVLRGGSCATPRSHIRSTYRNFFPASMRWQFCGLRLARDGGGGGDGDGDGTAIASD